MRLTQAVYKYVDGPERMKSIEAYRPVKITATQQRDNYKTNDKGALILSRVRMKFFRLLKLVTDKHKTKNCPYVPTNLCLILLLRQKLTNLLNLKNLLSITMKKIKSNMTLCI